MTLVSCFLYLFVQVQNHETLVSDHLLLDIDDLKITGVSDLVQQTGQEQSLYLECCLVGFRIF